MVLSYQRTRRPWPLTLSLYHSFRAHHPLDTADLPLLQHSLRVLSLHRDYAECLAVWRALDRPGFPVDATTLGIVLHACDQQSDDLAWRIFRRFADASPSSVLPSPPYESEQRSPLVFSHEALARERAVSLTTPFNLLHYTHIISALARSTAAYHVMTVLAHMRYHRVQGDLYLYTRALQVLGTRRLYREQEAVLRDMSLYGVPADEKCYYLVVLCHGRSGRWKEAMAFIEEMRQRRLALNEHIYEAAFVACERAGKLELAKDFSREMNARGVVMTWGAYASLVQQARKAGEWEWVLLLYHAVKGRKRYREHALTNDAVLHAAHQLTPRRLQGEFASSPVDSLRLSPAEVAAELEDHLGPLGYWVQLQEKVREMKENGDETLDPVVREKLAQATTPTTTGPHRMGVIVMARVRSDAVDEDVRPLMYLQVPSHQRLYRITAPSEPVDHTTASLDLLLQCVYWKAAMELQLRGGGAGLSDEERAWMRSMEEVPSCYDTLEVRCHTDVLPADDDDDYDGGYDGPTVGQFVAQSVNSLWSLLTKPLSSTPLEPSPPPVLPYADTEEVPIGSPVLAPQPLTPRPRPAEEELETGSDLGRALVEQVREHLRAQYGLKVKPPMTDSYDWVLSIGPAQLRSWVQAEYEERLRKRRLRRTERRRGRPARAPDAVAQQTEGSTPCASSGSAAEDGFAADEGLSSDAAMPGEAHHPMQGRVGG